MIIKSKYFVEYNNIKSSEIGANVITRPIVPAPLKRYVDKNIDGQNGTSVEDTGLYEDIEISVQFNFISKNPNEWNSDYRKFKMWIFKNINKKLSMNDDYDIFYNVKKVSISTPERIIKRIGKLEVIFTCEPFSYLKTGDNFIELINNSIILNSYLESTPIYKITGEGLINLTVNNNTVKINVGQSITVDTELQLCFKNRDIHNIQMEGEYEELKLLEGENTVSWTGGKFEIEILPRWRVI